MVELERNILPKLSQYMTSWKRYVDDTISYVKVDCIENVLNTLNSFHANISFTYGQDCDGMISLLDVSIMSKNYTIETTVIVNKLIMTSIDIGSLSHQRRGNTLF